VLVGPLHDGGERTGHFRLNGGDLAFHDFTGGAVDAEEVIGTEGLAVDGQLAGLGVDAQGASAGDAGSAHAAGDDGGVAGHAAGAGEDALGNVHAADVGRLGFAADEDDLFAVVNAFFGFIGGERQLADGRAGGGREAGGDDVLGGLGVEGGVEELIER